MVDLNLVTLLSLIEEMPEYRRLCRQLQQPESGVRVVVPDSAKSYLLAALLHQFKQTALIVTARPENAGKLAEQISSWCSAGRILHFPEPDTMPYQRITSDVTTGQDRQKVLFTLIDAGKKDNGTIIVTSAPALMQKMIPYRDFIAACLAVKVDMKIDPLELSRRLEAAGYTAESLVEVPGTVSRRGGILDIFPVNNDFPVRVEFLGNTIDSLRLFDPATQRSLKPVTSVDICPAGEVLVTPAISKEAVKNIDLSECAAEVQEQFRRDFSLLAEGGRPEDIQYYAPLFNTGSLLDYLPAGAWLVLDDASLMQQALETLDTQYQSLRDGKVGNGELPADFPCPYFSRQEVNRAIAGRKRLHLDSWEASENDMGIRLDFRQSPAYSGNLPLFLDKAGQLLREKRRVIIVSQQADRLAELLAEKDIIVAPVTEVKNLPVPGSLTLVRGTQDAGWIMGENTCLFTDIEIFGFIKQRRLVKKRHVSYHRLNFDFLPGEFVVHVEHGIGQFNGVTRLQTNDVEREYLVLSYAGGDKLYVPTDQIDRVSRYAGAGDLAPALSRLGTEEWSRTRQRVKEAVEVIAHELLQLYASREVVPGYAFSPDTVWQGEMEASFPYVETVDQLQAVEEVKEDMMQTKPMDRLVCGDVGYGKTEIAVRAAFKAVMDGRQVAVLVPTTVLAQQHFTTFSQRMSAFPVKVEVLSRFRSARDQKKVLAELAVGKVDICIGTHRLLQKDVVFKDLGLLIIDEEQRFGVVHKEYLKQMRQEVDVLTLSATPIPRTLHMSLVGVRDMSTMQTPPEDRLPIKTYVAQYNEQLVREAILREMERNGQVFFLHNRVQSIGYQADKLKRLVPEARISIGHGQMPEEVLEKVMLDFSEGRSDVLMCTTIIESGLDMPNVNTLIVNQADRFGLTQLYQLRGRIGRGANLAHAYFLYDQKRRLTPTAEKRLRTIYEATELGAGFGIAMKDLEIRGAGTLLGTRQSGHIAAVGFNLYTQLLTDAVEEQKALRAGVPPEQAKPARLPPATIDLPLSAFIPDDYVPDVDTRLTLYQSLVKIADADSLDSFAQELHDRFGVLPDEVKNLLYVVKVKEMATQAAIESVSTGEGQIIIRLFEGMQFDKKKLQPVMRDGIRVGVNQIQLNLNRLGDAWRRVLEELLSKMP